MLIYYIIKCYRYNSLFIVLIFLLFYYSSNNNIGLTESALGAAIAIKTAPNEYPLAHPYKSCCSKIMHLPDTHPHTHKCTFSVLL